ncbi:glycosyltransferase involved in cell wall biosynthesis [Thermolongibacillus altinsuensis]|uniref:Glycosyltransferase involved in cell wall biosynthesis n=1 Tax=Thermolongibacillus altinsuensis TaxID=575256 RepID=A0A4R1QJ28_9BACL|nr:glycosyltransferase family 4 protein [Thermolongibacillus altinsuensis]TCL52833.1 glycosyltransferase involved in cell wall biosynthesis [Thermolongibacillus altinsuensis]
MKGKKILQVCAIDLSVDALLKPLILKSMEEGYIVHNACTDTGKFEQLRKEGLTMINIKIDRKISPISNLKSIIDLYKLMKSEKYDIVHVHTPIAALLGRIAAKLAGIKHIIYTAHGFYFHEDMPSFQYKLFYNIEKYAARFLTDWLLLQSREDYELSLKDKFLEEDKIIHLSNGVDIYNKFNPCLISEDVRISMKRELQISNDDIVFTFIGRLVREKGIFELLEAFIELSKKYNNVKLLLIGDLLGSERDQESYYKIKELLSYPGIIYVGFRKDIPELLSISDVFVLPSYREGLPRSIIEAMAMEKPIIATNIRGCREEVFHEENGYLVKKASIKSLYEAMENLVKDKDKRLAFGERSRLIAEQLFDEEKVINKQIELFNSLVSKGD